MIEYYSNADHPGDTFCVNQVYYRAVGLTLDEALNVPGGDIHFYNGIIGGFVPSEGGDFYSEPYAYPVGSFAVSGEQGNYVTVAATCFDLEVTEGDIISLDAYLVGYIGGVLPYGTPDDTGFELCMYDPDNDETITLISFTLYDLYTLWHEHDYADEYWINHFSAEVPLTGTYRFGLWEWRSVDAETEEDLYTASRRLLINIDNVAITHASGLAGDVDLDGKLTFSDISTLYMYLLGLVELSPEAASNADFNGDGFVNFQDISDFYMYMTSNGD